MKTKKQYAVFGLGRFGESMALTLEELGCDVIAVDHNEERVQEISDKVSFAMRGDLTEPEVIKSLGARNLDGAVIAIAENLEASIMATIISKEIGIPYIIAKADSDIHEKILLKIGADKIVHPERDTGRRVAKNIMAPSFTDLIELSPDYSLATIELPEEWIGKTLVDLSLRKKHHLNVVGTMRGEEMNAEVDPHEVLQAGVKLVVVGANKSLEKFKS